MVKHEKPQESIARLVGRFQEKYLLLGRKAGCTGLFVKVKTVMTHEEEVINIQFIHMEYM